MTKKSTSVVVQNYNDIADSLKLDYPKLSDYERLTLAVYLQRNQIFQEGLVVSCDSSHPAGLAGIALAIEDIALNQKS